MRHGGAAAVAHMHGPAFGGKLLAGGLVAGQTGVLAGDDEALGALPEEGSGLAVTGALPQPALLLGQDLVGCLVGGRRGQQGIRHERHPLAEAAKHSTRGGKQGKAPHGGALVQGWRSVRPVRRRAWAAAD